MLRVLCVKSTFLSYFITRCFAIEFFYVRLNLFVDQKPHSWKTKANKRAQWRGEDLFWTSRKSTRRDVLTSQNVGNLCALSFIKIPGEPAINSQNRESVQGRKQLPLELLLISVKCVHSRMRRLCVFLHRTVCCHRVQFDHVFVVCLS